MPTRPTPTAAKLVTRDDPRVTRVGRFIRKTSLDELPQLFNVVVQGQPVAGRPASARARRPRPRDRLYDEVVDGYFARHRVKPGVTGWAQINGWRGETDTDEKIQQRVEHDLYYIENWSVLFDLYILVHDAVPPAQHGERLLSVASRRRGRGAAAPELAARPQARRLDLRRSSSSSAPSSSTSRRPTSCCSARSSWSGRSSGCSLNRHFAPMVVLLLLYLAGGIPGADAARPTRRAASSTWRRPASSSSRRSSSPR